MKPYEILDNYPATLHNDNRIEEIFEIQNREAGETLTYATSRVHAELIIKAVNCHDDMLTALKHAVKLIEDYEGLIQDYGAWGDDDQDTLELMNAAIAKAEGGV